MRPERAIAGGLLVVLLLFAVFPAPAPEGSGRTGPAARGGQQPGESSDRAGASTAPACGQAAPGRSGWRPIRVRFGNVIELVSLDLPDAVRPGTRVLVCYRWRAIRAMSRDYWTFVHFDGGARRFDQDHRLGGDVGTSRWTLLEPLEEALHLAVPGDAPPGDYRVRLGVWYPRNRTRLAVTGGELPHGGHAVLMGILRVSP